MEGSCGLTRPGKISQPQSFIVSSSVSFQGLVLWITSPGFLFLPWRGGCGNQARNRWQDNWQVADEYSSSWQWGPLASSDLVHDILFGRFKGVKYRELPGFSRKVLPLYCSCVLRGVSWHIVHSELNSRGPYQTSHANAMQLDQKGERKRLVEHLFGGISLQMVNEYFRKLQMPVKRHPYCFLD